MGTSSQRALHVAGAPVNRALMHVSSVRHALACGQRSGGSQASPLSTRPLPHVAEQSLSVSGVAPLGQQPSPGMACLISTGSHRAPQRLPSSRSTKQPSRASQPSGHAPGSPCAIATSQRSSSSTRPLPHAGSARSRDAAMEASLASDCATASVRAGLPASANTISVLFSTSSESYTRQPVACTRAATQSRLSGVTTVNLLTFTGFNFSQMNSQ